MAALLSARPQAAAAGAEYGQTGHRPIPDPDTHLSRRARALLALLTFAFLAPLFFAPVAYSTVDSDFDSDLAPYAAVRLDPGNWQWNAAYGLGQPVADDPLSAIFNPLAAGLLLGLSPERGLEPLLWC